MNDICPLCLDLPPEPVPPEPPDEPPTLMIVIVSVGGVLLIAGVAVLIWWCTRSKEKGRTPRKDFWYKGGYRVYITPWRNPLFVWWRDERKTTLFVRSTQCPFQSRMRWSRKYGIHWPRDGLNTFHGLWTTSSCPSTYGTCNGNNQLQKR